MYAADFNYYRARSVTEAGDLLAKYPGAKVLAGGRTGEEFYHARLWQVPLGD